MTAYKYHKDDPLKVVISVRVSTAYYQKLERQLAQSNCRSVGELARKILMREEVIWYHKDARLDGVAAGLAGIKSELRAIGTNINQITRHFNSTHLPSQKMFDALKVLDEYKKVNGKVDELLRVIAQLSDKWWPR